MKKFLLCKLDVKKFKMFWFSSSMTSTSSASSERNEFFSQNLCAPVSAPHQCGAVDCELCHTIQEMTGSDWVFEWIRKLADWERTRIGRHVHQMKFGWGVETKGAEVDEIRTKLALFQTQTVIPCLM